MVAHAGDAELAEACCGHFSLALLPLALHNLMPCWQASPGMQQAPAALGSWAGCPPACAAASSASTQPPAQLDSLTSSAHSHLACKHELGQGMEELVPQFDLLCFCDKATMALAMGPADGWGHSQLPKLSRRALEKISMVMKMIVA